MHTSEERIAAMHARAAEIQRSQRARRVRIMQSAGAAASFAAVILLAVFMPRLATFETIPADGAGSANDMHASMLYESGAMGYVVIAIVAFLLGVSVTVFCFRLKQWQDGKNEEADL